MAGLRVIGQQGRDIERTNLFHRECLYGTSQLGFNSTFMIDTGEKDPRNRTDDLPEDSAGLWAYADVLATTSYGDAHPFTGRGWEGNYDSFCATDTGESWIRKSISLMSESLPFQ